MNSPEQTTQQPPPGEIPRWFWLKVIVGTPLALFGGAVTFFVGLFLCGYFADRLGGGHPAPYMIRILITWLFLGATPLVAGILLLRRTPSTERFWRRAFLGVLLLFLV